MEENILRIEDLKPGMEEVTLRVQVLRLLPPREITTRFNRSHRLVEGMVEDSSGQVSITFWNDHVESLKDIEPGDLIEVRNCFISSFRGKLIINVGRDSKMRKVEKMRKENPTRGGVDGRV